MYNTLFSWARCFAVLIKEFMQMKRDRLTFAMIIGIPILQLILFGYAINTNPKHLPTVVVSVDHSQFTRSFIAGLENSDYFKIIPGIHTEAQAEHMLAANQTMFVVNIPANFSRTLVRGERPKLLVEADGTIPSAVGNAASAVGVLSRQVFNPDFKGGLQGLQTKPPAVDLITHIKYNPETITQYSIVPGLLGVVLTMTLVLITSLALTRENERGTIESLLATPVRPLEVMIGKIVPYIIVGYIQVLFILVVAYYLFRVPIAGSLSTLLLACLPFIAANLCVGLTFSSIAKNQLQAVQMSFFFFLPSILLSGFMFPFRGMPQWAQRLGEVLPLTHFVRIIRGIMLKGNGWPSIWPNIWPILIFMIVAVFVGIKRYRQTLD